MDAERKENVTVGLLILLLIAVVAAFAYLIYAGYLELIIGAILIIAIAAIVIFVITYFFLGVFYFVKEKDTVHVESASTLDDITEVRGAMNNGDRKD